MESKNERRFNMHYGNEEQAKDVRAFVLKLQLQLRRL